MATYSLTRLTRSDQRNAPPARQAALLAMALTLAALALPERGTGDPPRRDR